MQDPIIRSHSNRVYIRFVSDRSNSAAGFQMYYDGTLSGEFFQLSELTEVVVLNCRKCCLGPNCCRVCVSKH